MRVLGNASKHGWRNDSVRWGDRQHIQTAQQILDVNNGGERDLDGRSTWREPSVDAENNIQMFV